LEYWNGVHKEILIELQPLYFYNSPFKFWQLVKGQRIGVGFGIADLNYATVLQVLDLYEIPQNVKFNIFDMIIKIDNIYQEVADRSTKKDPTPPTSTYKH